MTKAERSLLDALLPGSQLWPSAGTALCDASESFVVLDPSDRAVFQQWAARVDATDLSRRAGLLREIELSEKKAFVRILSSVYRAYYSTASVQGRIAKLASSAPSELSPHVDHRLTTAVLTHRRGNHL